MKLLVTGATGFVGRNAILTAAGRYDEIIAAVRSPEKLATQLAGENLSDLNKVRPISADPALWRDIEPDHAILSAGVLFARDREEYFSTNVEWMMRILYMLPERCRVVILSSQSAGGPTPEGQSARNEADGDNPITWYGESKLAMEKKVRAAFPDRFITILRPPMVLGPRDAATLPLFRMGRGPLRIKPGLHTKNYSFIAVEDLVDAIFTALDSESALPGSLYVASRQIFSDWEFIASAASTPGFTLAIPQPLIRVLSAVVDAVPSLRSQTPSLTRDRAREIWPPRWVVDGTRFEELTGWAAKRSLQETMSAALEYYRKTGRL